MLNICLHIIQLINLMNLPLVSFRPAKSMYTVPEASSNKKFGKKVSEDAELCPILKALFWTADSVYISIIFLTFFFLTVVPPSGTSISYFSTFSLRFSDPYINELNIVLFPHPVFPKAMTHYESRTMSIYSNDFNKYS